MSINIYADLSLNAWASYTPLLGQLRFGIGFMQK